MKLQRNTADLLPKLKSMALADRAVFEKGMKAFVSYVQAYAKHECNLIFRLKDLDFASLAQGFALLRMPKMPELRGKQFQILCLWTLIQTRFHLKIKLEKSRGRNSWSNKEERKQNMKGEENS